MRVLVFDTDGQLGDNLKLNLPREYAPSRYALEESHAYLVLEERPDVVILEHDGSHEALRRRIHAISSVADPPAVIVSGDGTDVATAVVALRSGAVDYATNRSAAEEIERRIRDAARIRFHLISRPADQVFDASEEVVLRFVGTSPLAHRLRKTLIRFGAVQSAVVLTGESGTGKEVAAHILHELSSRSNRKFVPVNCAAVPPPIFESEFFGSEKGAFTDAVTRPGYIQEADGGTLFLDEIGELPLYLQAKLLRALENGSVYRVGGRHPIPVDVRTIAATNRNLKAMVEAGQFRRDLFYRIAVLACEFPPLRSRREDIITLALHYLSRHHRQFRLSPAAARRLTEYDWPGNVRELRNTLERAVAFCDQPVIQAEHIAYI